jgi:hypothetical protein
MSMSRATSLLARLAMVDSRGAQPLILEWSDGSQPGAPALIVRSMFQMGSLPTVAGVSLALAAGMLDCLALPAVVFTTIAKFSDTRPALSVGILLLAFALVVVLFAVPLALDEHGESGGS